MPEVLQIAIGIWFGGLLLIGTIIAMVEINNWIRKNIHSAQVRNWTYPKRRL